MDCKRCQTLLSAQIQIAQILVNSRASSKAQHQGESLREAKFWNRAYEVLNQKEIWENLITQSELKEKSRELSNETSKSRSRSEEKTEFSLIEKLLEDDFGDKCLSSLLNQCSQIKNKFEIPREDVFMDMDESAVVKGGYKRIADIARKVPSYMESLIIFVEILAKFKIKSSYWKVASKNLVSEYLTWKLKENDPGELAFLMRITMDKVFLQKELRLNPPIEQAIAIPNPTISFSKKYVRIGNVTFKLEPNGFITINNSKTPILSLEQLLKSCSWNFLYPIGPYILAVGYAEDMSMNVCTILAWTGYWLEIMIHKAIQCMNISRFCLPRNTDSRFGGN